jgi:hypothetical protein
MAKSVTKSASFSQLGQKWNLRKAVRKNINITDELLSATMP